GREVVAVANLAGPGTPAGLWAFNFDGSNLRLLNSPVSSVGVKEPVWSPDGSMIAFSSDDGTISDIWVISLTGALRQLTSKALNNRQPAWSPDSKQIAFVSDRGGSNDIWIMNADGSGQTRVTNLPGQENHPSFSPDGSAIVFSETTTNVATTTNASASLMIVNVDGSNLETLTTGLFNDWDPSWGPSGIVFSSDRDSTSSPVQKIWFIRPNGTGLRKLGNVIGLDPVWIDNGQILFVDEF